MPYTFIPNLRPLYPRDASREVDAIWVTERADHVNTPVAGKSEIWLESDETPSRLYVTDEDGLDKRVMLGPTVAGSVPNAIPTFDSARNLQNNTGLTFVSPQLNMAVTGANIAQAESSTAPSTNAGKGYWWVKDNAIQNPRFTDDTGADWDLIRHTAVSAVAANTIPTFAHSTGKYLTYNADLKYDGATLSLEDAANANLNLTENGTGPSPAAGTGAIWVQNTAPTTLIFTDDTGVDNTVLGSGGTVAQDAMLLDIRADHVNTPGADRIEVWADDAFNTLQYTDEGGTDRIIVGAAGVGSANSIPTFTGTKAAIANNSTLTYNTGVLLNSSTTATFELQERAAAPASTTATGKVWIKDTVPCGLWYTDDTSDDWQLGIKCITISAVVNAATTWNSWSTSGPYNDTTWTSTFGSGAAPTTGYWLNPPLFHFPGAVDIVKVQIQSYHISAQSFEFELVGMAQEDSDTAAGTVDPICDASIEGDSLATAAAKLLITDVTINDRTVAAGTSLFAFFKETSATTDDFRCTIQIWYRTTSITGWDFA